MARKGENIYKRKDGRWEGRYIKGRHLNGSARFGYVYDRTFRGVRQKLQEKKYQYRFIVTASDVYKGTVAEWINEWLEGSIQRTVKRSTFASYRYKLTRYVCPYFEAVSLCQLSPEIVQDFVDSLEKKGLSGTTIRMIIQILKRSLRGALQRNYLRINPIQNIVYPTKAPKKIFALSEEEQVLLEEKARQHPKGLPILLSLHTGLRIGEISALKWSDIDLTKGEITVSRTLQRISLPSKNRNSTIMEGSAKSLSAHRVIPLNDRIWGILKEKKQTANSPYVVGSQNRFFEPRTITHQFKQILAQIQIKEIHFHQLRHTFATRLLEKGADIASVSALLGHQSAKMTLDIYIGSLMTQRKKWVNRL
ncbi:hypothetical protein IGI37_003337 [Enterococcus sp. AZ194]|uniref:tyrosine-type recombinase/integrase n=1 Tax=Enterococcus sp. AZ194 TaxID=2774629 RepID=UPI003F20EFA5